MKENIRYVVEKLKAFVGPPDFPGMLGSPELPVKLIVLPEAFATGWPDQFYDMDHVEACKKVYNTTVPGPETDLLGEAAKYTGAYIMACTQALEPELMEDRFFNIAFIKEEKMKFITLLKLKIKDNLLLLKERS